MPNSSQLDRARRAVWPRWDRPPACRCRWWARCGRRWPRSDRAGGRDAGHAQAVEGLWQRSTSWTRWRSTKMDVGLALGPDGRHGVPRPSRRACATLSGSAGPGRGRADWVLGAWASGSYVDDLDLEANTPELRTPPRPPAECPRRAWPSGEPGKPRSGPPVAPRWSPRRSRWSRPRHRPRYLRVTTVARSHRAVGGLGGVDHGGRLQQALEQTDPLILHLPRGCPWPAW